MALTAAQQRGRCFSSPGTPTHDYTDGDWVPFTHHRYKILAHFWEQLGTTIKSTTPQNYGRCDRVTPNRILYEWQPHRCRLDQFSVQGVCEVLRGKSLLMVGDSTVFQLWLSFALLLGAQLGKNVKKASTVSEITASACGDATRLAFVRNDLVLYTSNVGDLMSAKRCDGFLSMQNFAVRAARDADIVVLGVGHHFTGSLDMALDYQGGPSGAKRAPLRARLQYNAFLPFSLNHTLTHLIAAREAYGHADAAASILLVGISSPVAGCSRFRAPISLAQYATSHYEHRRTIDSPMWLSYARLNVAASYVARGAGIHYLDIAAPSAMRPDAAMARFWGDAGKVKEDCLHYCMPGPVDTWSTLIYNWLASSAVPSVASGAAPLVRVGSVAGAHHGAPKAANDVGYGVGGAHDDGRSASAAGDGLASLPATPKPLEIPGFVSRRQQLLRLNGSLPNMGRAGSFPFRRNMRMRMLSHDHNQSLGWGRPPRSSRFFKLNLTRWLSERGAATWMEKCSSAACWTPRLTKQWWWAFNCSGPRG